MQNARPERRGSHLAPMTWTLLAAFAATGCIGVHSTHARTDYSAPETADLADEISLLVDELTERAGLRIPLGSVRVIIDEPVPIRPKSARFRPAAQGERDRRATQAAVRFELEMALGNRMNVVGAGDLASGPLGGANEVSSSDTISLAQRAARTGATHALLGTFVRDGDDLDLSIRLVEFETEWIVATARRKIVDFVPDAYDEQFGTSIPSTASADHMKRTAEIIPATDGSIGAPAEVAAGAGDARSEPASASGAELNGGANPGRGATDFSAPIEFDTGPAAARLRALERLKVKPPAKTPAKSQY